MALDDKEQEKLLDLTVENNVLLRQLQHDLLEGDNPKLGSNPERMLASLKRLEAREG